MLEIIIKKGGAPMLNQREKKVLGKYLFWRNDLNYHKRHCDPCSVGGPTCGCETGCKCSIGCGGPKRTKNDHETPLIRKEL